MVTLRAWSRVEGRALCGDQPRAGEQIKLSGYRQLGSSSIYYTLETRSDGDGAFAFERVPPLENEFLSVGINGITSKDYTQVETIDHEAFFTGAPGETVLMALGGIPLIFGDSPASKDNQ